MYKAFLFTILILSHIPAFTQNDIDSTLKSFINLQQYDEIIAKYAPISRDYSSKGLYYIGLAYYMKENDEQCIRFMELSIGKDPSDPKPHFIKANTLNYMARYQEAEQSFQKAIDLYPENGEYYSGLGDARYNLKRYEPALEAYKMATRQKNCPDRPWSMIAQIYSERKENDNALEAYYAAKLKISKKSDSYKNALFNIGSLELLTGDYDKAESAFADLIQIDSLEYHSYAKLIQIYYHRKEYDKANPIRQKLYAAHKKGILKGNVKNMFCFDQFPWKDKLVQAFERYEEENKMKIFEKHVFYIVNQNEKAEFKIQTEYSPVSVEQGGPKYLLCMSKGNEHATFPIGFNDDFKYDDLKQAVIDVLEGKVKPLAVSKPTKN